MIVKPLGSYLILILEMTPYPGPIIDALYGNVVVLCVYKFIDNRFQLLCIYFEGPKAYIHFVRLKAQMRIQY